MACLIVLLQHRLDVCPPRDRLETAGLFPHDRQQSVMVGPAIHRGAVIPRVHSRVRLAICESGTRAPRRLKLLAEGVLPPADRRRQRPDFRDGILCNTKEVSSRCDADNSFGCPG